MSDLQRAQDLQKRAEVKCEKVRTWWLEEERTARQLANAFLDLAWDCEDMVEDAQFIENLQLALDRAEPEATKWFRDNAPLRIFQAMGWGEGGP